MSGLRGTTQRELAPRPAFDLVQEFLTTNVLAALGMTGMLEELETSGIRADSVKRLGAEEGALLEAILHYLTQRGLVDKVSGVFKLSELGSAVCRDKGYLVWVVGGYGEALRHLDGFLSGSKRYGTDHQRDGRWVAGGTAILARRDAVPHAMRLLEQLSFDHALDLGCGNARFLLTVCQKFNCSGVGIDINTEACGDALRAVEAAGMIERVQIAQGDVINLDKIPLLEETQLVITFFLLHEILALGRSVLVEYLSDMASRLPAGAYLMAGEVQPPKHQAATTEWFSPEFTFIHALMRQSLLSENEWRKVLQEAGFTVQETVPLDLPGGVLLLGQTAKSS